MIEIREITKRFGAKEVLRGVNFDLKSSSLAGLIGPSGGGKSVLMKIIGGVIPPSGGTVEFKGEQPSVSLMFQEGALFDSIDVFDNIAFPLVGGRVPSFILPRKTRDEVCGKVSAVLARVGLSKAAHKMPGQLSGGMRRRVSLARALVARPSLLLLDDPTSGLDPVASSVIMDLISELHRDYRPTALMVSHDLRRLLPVVDTVYALFDGKIAFAGTVAELKEHAPAELQTFVACRSDLVSRELCKSAHSPSSH